MWIPNVRLPERLPSHIPALDGLRGMAILLVLLYHCFPFLITRLGWVGVDLFFVLSGFLITGILLDTKYSKGYYKNFIVRRVLRIFPLYYLVLCILFIFIPLVGLEKIRGQNFIFYSHHQQWFWLYMQNWLFSIKGFPENHSLVHFWSLAVEEQFYIFWPIIIYILPRRFFLLVTTSLIIFSILFRLKLGQFWSLNYTYPYLSTLSRMDALLVGGIIAYLIRYQKSILEKTIPFIMVLAVCGSIMGIFIIKSASFLRLYPIYTLFDISFACMLVYSLTIKKNLCTIVFQSSALQFLGKYSYGIYVYHYILYEMVAMHFFKVNTTNGIPEINYIQILILGICIVLISIGISWISYRFWEKPFLGMKKYFYPTSPSQQHMRKKLLILPKTAK
ncbi:MAG: acyltransferase [Thermoflavifilum sp.]|nr:acyltransferase [Thermoflavifilum sp.]